MANVSASDEPKPHRWRELTWSFADQGRTPIRTLAYVWTFASLVLLIPSSILTRKVDNAILFGEAFAGAYMIVAARLANRREFLDYSLERVLSARKALELAARMKSAFEILVWSLHRTLGKVHIDAFMLRPSGEDSAPSEDERPGDLGELTWGIDLDLFDEAIREGPPWPSVREVIDKLRSAVQEGPVAVRAVLRSTFTEVPPWYRQRAALLRDEKGRGPREATDPYPLALAVAKWAAVNVVGGVFVTLVLRALGLA